MHLKEYGYTVNKKLKEYQLELKDFDCQNLADLLQDNYKIVEGNKDFKIKNYGRKIFDLLYSHSISGFPIVIEEAVYERFFKNLNKLFGEEDLVIIVNENDDVIGAMLITNNTSLALQTTDGKELSSKNMYTVDIENHKYVDLSLFVTAKDYKDIAEKILINILICSMKRKNNKYINTNLWIQNIEDIGFLNHFDINWNRERVIFSKTLKSINVKRDKSEMLEPNSFAINSTVR